MMMIKTRHTQLGLTLVELMISLSIALFIAFAVGAFYVANKYTYSNQEQLSRLQEAGRFSNYYLTLELRAAGYQGCANSANVTINNLISAPSAALSNTNAIQGYDGSSMGTFSPALSTAIKGSPVANSDVIAIHTVGSTAYNLTTAMTTPTDALTVSSSAITAGQPVLIANCGAADLFMASSGSTPSSILHTATDNTSSSLSLAYSAGVTVLPYYYYAYYVRDTGRVNTLNQPIYALVREDSANNINEIAEGVERMKVSYVLDTDLNQGPNQETLTATTVNNANNWSKVIGIQISLLLTTNENVSKTIQSYFFNGASATPTDRRLRRQWDVFVNLRNQGGQ